MRYPNVRQIAFRTAEDKLISIANAISDEVRSSTFSEDDLLTMTREIHQGLRTELLATTKDYQQDTLQKAIVTVRAEFDARFKALEGRVEQAMGSLLKAIKSLPVPKVEVNIPGQPTPNVNVNVPESIINVNVPRQNDPIVNVSVPQQTAPSIQVNIPEQKLPDVRIDNIVNVPQHKSIVNVNVPEQKPAEITLEGITVNVPKDAIKLELSKRTTTSEKSIIYGPTGRPDKIVEQTTEE